MTTDTSQTPPGGAWAGRLILALLSLAVMLGAGEVAVRLINPPPRVLHHVNVAGYRLSANPIRKYEYAPGRFDVGAGGFEDHSNFVINRHGFRDREFSVAKPPGTVRILALGDSVTAGNGVPDYTRTYPQLLERALNRSVAGRAVEVFNLGVGGYHTLQEIETLREVGLAFNPDIVMLGFVINDFDEDVDGGVYRNLMRQIGNTEQRVLRDALAHPSWRTWQYLLGKSRLVFFVYYRGMELLAKVRGQGFNYQRDVLKDRNPVESGLELLSRLQQERGFKVVIVIIPAFDWKDRQYRYADIHARLKAVVDRYPAFQVADLLPGFLAAEKDGAKFTFDGLHPNEAGHQLVADALALTVGAMLAGAERGRLP